MSLLHTRWAALGAVVAITLSAGGIGTASIGTGERTVFVPITPCRLVDTRPAFQVGPRSAPLTSTRFFASDEPNSCVTRASSESPAGR